MQIITIKDLALVNSLGVRAYTENTLLSNATIDEKDELLLIRRKLKSISDFFANKYSTDYGPFQSEMSTGNPVARSGTLNNVWAGLFKGSPQKQYAAQVSFVINRLEPCLDVGFYFGRASSRSLPPLERTELESLLNSLGTNLSDTILNNNEFKERYNSLFDFGFLASSNNISISPENWYNQIRTHTKDSQIVAKIYPNDFGIIENSIIDSFVSQIIFLMGAINQPLGQLAPIIIKPLTPEQRAKQAERYAQIGQNGELYVLKHEQEKLIRFNITRNGYPRHVSLESMHYGYDILSMDENGNDIFIEVKTTTRAREDKNSRNFFLSLNEFSVFSDHKQQYKVYRVYDIEKTPSIDILDLDTLTKKPDGYVINY